MSARLTRIFPVVIIILGCWLRLRYFGDIEFKKDEAAALEMMQKFLSGEIVTRGLTASIGVANPPLFIYLMAPVRLVTSSPYLTTLYITLLNIIALIMGWILYRKRFGEKTATLMLLFFATSPWAVLFSRKLWAQDLLPVFMIPFWYGLLVWAQSGLSLQKNRNSNQDTTGWLIFIVAMAFWIPQIHMSGIILIPIIALLYLLLRPPYSWHALLTGVLIGVIPAIPYILFLVQDNLHELQRAIHHGGVTHFDPGALLHFLSPSNGLGFERILGPQEINDLHHFLKKPLFALCMTAFWCQIILMLYALVALAQKEHRTIKTPLLTTFSVMGAFLLVSRITVYPHYFIVLFPLPFLLLALGSTHLFSRFTLGWQKKVIWCLVATMITGNLVYTVGMQEFIHDTGGVSGDYGISLQHKVAVVKAASGCGNYVTFQKHPLPDEYIYLAKQMGATCDESTPELMALRHYDISPCFKKGSCEKSSIISRSGPLILVEQEKGNPWS